MEEKYLSAGFASYLTKPVQSGKLDDMLLRFLPKEKIIYQGNETKEITPQAPASETGGSDYFDMNTGIMYNGGSREIYFTVLKMFVSSGGEKLAQIKKLAENESWKDYITEVHALKSTSLMIGSGQLSEAAKELELAGKAGNYALIKEKNGALLELYESVIGTANSLLVSEEAIDGEPPAPRDVGELSAISAEKLAEYIRLIKEACADYDDDEAARLCGEAGGYSFDGKALAPLLEEVKNAAVDFEYDEAAKRAQAIADELLK